MKYIFKCFYFQLFNFKSIDVLLNQMAQKGYEFKGTGTGWIKEYAMFERSEAAKELKYAVDVRGDLTEEEREAYYDFYRQLGWESRGAYQKKMHIFVSQGGEVPLYSDSTTEVENFMETAQISWQVVKCILAMVFFGAMMKFVMSFGDNMGSRPVSYGLLVMSAAIFLQTMIVGMNYIWYGQMCRRSIAEGSSLPVNPFLTELQFYGTTVSFVLFAIMPVFSVYVFLGILNTGSVGYNSTLVWALLYAQVMSVPLVLITTYLLFRNPKNRGLKVINFICAYLYMIGFFSAINMANFR